MQRGDQLTAAEEAAAEGRRLGDRDLEAFALSQVALGLVWRSRLSDGLPLHDEVGGAVVGGEVRDRHVASEVLCNVLFGCDAARDYRRALEWCTAAEAIGRERGGSFRAAVCRVTRAAVMAAAGDWRAAEQDLVAAKSLYEASHYALRTPAVARLAELRVRQGRQEQAEELLATIDHQESVGSRRARRQR